MNDKLHNNIPRDIMDYIKFYTESRVSALSKLCPAADPRKTVTQDECLKYFKEGETLYASTVTIGDIKILKLGYEQQIAILKKYIDIYRDALPPADRYMFIIESNKAGNAHLHGICTGYQKIFTDVFKKLGRMNSSEASYKSIHDLAAYKRYIMKDQQGWSEAITNVSFSQLEADQNWS